MAIIVDRPPVAIDPRTVVTTTPIMVLTAEHPELLPVLDGLAAPLAILGVRRRGGKRPRSGGGLQREEKQFETWLQERQPWLLRVTRRSRRPALTEQSPR